jgi:hypothetical protein
VRIDEQVLAHPLHDLAGLIELDQRVGVRADAIILAAAALENPDRLAVLVVGNAADRAELEIVRNLKPGFVARIPDWERLVGVRALRDVVVQLLLRLAALPGRRSARWRAAYGAAWRLRDRLGREHRGRRRAY